MTSESESSPHDWFTLNWQPEILVSVDTPDCIYTKLFHLMQKIFADTGLFSTTFINFFLQLKILHIVLFNYY